jgi:hypothetical protein
MTLGIDQEPRRTLDKQEAILSFTSPIRSH